MAQIAFADQALADAERILRHLVEHEVADAGERVADIFSAVDVLERHPLIGRPAPPELRELVIGTGSRGYVALYRYEALDDLVLMLAIRAQREKGFAGPSR